LFKVVATDAGDMIFTTGVSYLPIMGIINAEEVNSMPPGSPFPMSNKPVLRAYPATPARYG